VNSLIKNQSGPQISKTVEVDDALAGSLIGRGGENVRAIQDQSGASVHIPKQADGGVRKVLIKATSEEAINKAHEHILKILAKAEEEGVREGRSNWQQEQMEIDPEHVGMIIGRGGENIHGLSAKTGCKITVDKTQRDDNRRFVELKGSPEQIAAAKSAIKDLLREQLDRNANRDGRNFVGGVSDSVTISQEHVGLIIGRGGEQIRQIQADCASRVAVSNKEETGGTRTFSVQGTEEAVEKTKKMIHELIAEAEARKAGAAGAKRGARGELPLLIREDQVGTILGKGGSKVKEIEQSCGAVVSIPRESSQEQGCPAGVRYLHIRGDPFAQSKCLEYLEDLMFDQDGTETQDFVTVESPADFQNRIGDAEKTYAVRLLVQDGGAVRIRGLLQGVHACAKGITQMHVQQRVSARAETIFADGGASYGESQIDASRDPRRRQRSRSRGH